MNLFRRRDCLSRLTPKPSVSSEALELEPIHLVQQKPPPRLIALSDEHKSLLEKPVHPRVDRILQEIYADRAAAERALNARRIIEFPPGDSGERHVIQDERGFWRIVPGPAPMQLNKFFDAL
jgi:streptomycin 6-kinase